MRDNDFEPMPGTWRKTRTVGYRASSLALVALAGVLSATSTWGQDGFIFGDGFESGSAWDWTGSVPAQPLPELCTRPIDLVDTSSPDRTVGTGTPQSCTASALAAAVPLGGTIVFDCGPNPHTIVLSQEIEVTTDTVLDGADKVTLDGQGVTRMLFLASSFELETPHLIVQRLTFRHGYGNNDLGGGAILRDGGTLSIIDSTFIDNRALLTGPDVGGGAVYSVGVGVTTVVGSLFDGNRASNGGALGNLHNQLTVVNSVLRHNDATGNAGNGGGSGGAIYIDGVDQDVITCGVRITGNTANTHGGGVFRVSNNNVGTHVTDLSMIADNIMPGASPSSAGGLYLQGVTITLTRSTLARNVSGFAGAVFVGPGSTITMSNVTVEGNVADPGLAGGIVFQDTTTGTIAHSSFVRNRAPDAGAFAGATAGGQNIVLSNSLFADNEAGNGYNPITCLHSMINGGGNIQYPVIRAGSGSDDPGSLCASGTLVADPDVGALRNHGGPTPTVMPSATGPAVDLGSGCAATDQRGVSRGEPCTSGAVEVP